MTTFVNNEGRNNHRNGGKTTDRCAGWAASLPSEPNFHNRLSDGPGVHVLPPLFIAVTSVLIFLLEVSFSCIDYSDCLNL